MNKTKIDWADMTWNPVTGCLHGCEYCYARKIAMRFDGHFKPTMHENRLADPTKTNKPQNIFVCSMADLFGEWVSDEWIKTVFKACESAPQHRYMFLTKNPDRYGNIRVNGSRGITVSKWLKDQIWLGATVTNQSQFDKASIALEDADQALYTFLSIEPILEQIKVTEIDGIANWVIVGAETGNRKEKVIPEKKWIDDITRDCRNRGVPIFMKESLRELMGADFVQEYPWVQQMLARLSK